MSFFRRFLSTTHERGDVERALQIIEHAFWGSRKPRGCSKSAESGAEIRNRLLAIVEDIEKETGQLAVVFAEDATLTHPKLIAALQSRRDDGELLKLAIDSCLVHPQATQKVNELWPTTVQRYRSRANTNDLIDEKATLLSAFVVHNLDAAIEARNELKAAGFGGTEQELTQGQMILLKVEEAACWYRVVDDLAYSFIREHRSLFMDYVLDELAHLLALQGAPPNLICQTMTTRSQEYGQYKQWSCADTDRMAGTLLWNAGKHVGEPAGLGRHFMFNIRFSTLFMLRVKRALIYELLTGKETPHANL
jgi:hypothetical protein